jgi:spermidine synthase
MVDVLLGVALILVYGGAKKIYLALAASIACGVGTVATAATFDPQKLVSGVFRSGQQKTDGQIIQIAHGRTATISTEINDGAISIRTNGKPDASAMQGFSTVYQSDEVTMTLLAAIPLMLHTAPRTVANIGFGSGITGETLLGDPRIERLDSIEIEPQMVELAHAFTGRNDRLYNDPRSKIHIDDAKAFFATAGKRYDLIVSEPSNPWVSGVAGLFSKEYYRHVVRHMETDGLFAQWLQVYESHPDRVASVLKAVDAVFEDYLVFAVDYGDLLIVAKPQGRILPAQINFQRLSPQIRQWLWHLEVANPSDITMRILGNKALFAPWLTGKSVPANSDFYPYVDIHAERDRFIGQNAKLQDLALSAFPIPELLGARAPLAAQSPLSLNRHFGLKPLPLYARLLTEGLPTDNANTQPVAANLPPEWRVEAGRIIEDCRNPPLADAPYAIARLLTRVLPYLAVPEARALMQSLLGASCLTTLNELQAPWATLLTSVLDRNPQAIGTAAQQLLENRQGVTQVRARYLLGMAMLGHLASGGPQRALHVWNTHARDAIGVEPPGIELEVLHAHALVKATGNRTAANTE